MQEESRVLEDALMEACERADKGDKAAKRRLFKRYQKAEGECVLSYASFVTT
jgi:hypothetical protein